MNKFFDYLPELITAIVGIFAGILLERVKANKEKRMDIYKLRKILYMEIIELISKIPSSTEGMETYKIYYQDLLDYYDKHTSELVLISNTRVADIFTEYIKLLGTYINKNQWDSYNRDEALIIAQKLINKMRRKLLSFD